MVYTSADKQAELTDELQDLSSVKFLKRGFPEVREPGDQRLCPLELTSILPMNYWCSNRRLQNSIFRDNWEIMLLELSLHPKEVWARYAPLVYTRYIRSLQTQFGPKSLPRIEGCDQELWRHDALAMENPW